MESVGNVQIFIPYYIWQTNKKTRILEECYQGREIYYLKATFIITHCDSGFRGANFIEKKVICWGQPAIQTTGNEDTYIINQYGQGNNPFQFNQIKINNEIIEIREYLSNAVDINIDEKEEVLSVLEKIIENNDIKKEEAENVLEIFNKYEPLLSLATNIITLIRSFI